MENARISCGQMEQLVAIVAVCRLAILKRMPATPLTMFVAHRVREQVKVQNPARKHHRSQNVDESGREKQLC